MHLLGCKISIIFPFCNAEMAKLGLITFTLAKLWDDKSYKCINILKYRRNYTD